MRKQQSKKDKLRFADITLLVSAALTLLSSLQMEASAGEPFIGLGFPTYTVAHIVLSISTMGLIFYHLYLHFGWTQWISKLRKTPKAATRILAVVAALALISGIAATLSFIFHNQHTPIGGVHGKIGLLMLAIAIGHTVRRRHRLKK